MAPAALGGRSGSRLSFVGGQVATRAAKYWEWSRETGHSQGRQWMGKRPKGGGQLKSGDLMDARGGSIAGCPSGFHAGVLWRAEEAGISFK